MDINEFICKNDVDFAAHLIKKMDLQLAETELGIKFGQQLTKYLLEYGYLGFESVEFYGMNSRQGLKSDMITQTQYLHRYYAETAPYIVLENYGEGDYILVDTEDNVFQYISEDNKLVSCDNKLFDYILMRFQEEM